MIGSGSSAWIASHPAAPQHAWYTISINSAAVYILLASSLMPVVVIGTWLYFRDRLREPVGVVLATVLLGVLVAVPAVGLELIANAVGVAFGLAHADGPRTLLHAGFTAFIVAAVIEELLKFAVLWGYAARRDAFDEPMDGIVYGAAASLGFAGIENVLYVIGAWSGNDGTVGSSLGVAIARALTAVPLHAACGVVMGACIGVARFSPRNRRLWIALGLAGAIGLHGFYDLAVMSGSAMDFQDSGVGVGMSFLGFAASLGAALALAMLALARLRRDQEVAIAGGISRPGVAPRLPMATCILAAAMAATSVVAVTAGIAVARGATQVEPMSEGLSGLLGGVVGLCVIVSLLLAAATLIVGTVALVRQPRWRATTVVSMVLAVTLGSAYVVLLIGVMMQQGGD